MSSKKESNIPDLGYLSIPDNVEYEWREAEGFKEKFSRKVKENPLVPIGLTATIVALTYGIYQMKTGDRVKSQRMMRLRIAAQGFTVFALLGGVAYTAAKAKWNNT